MIIEKIKGEKVVLMEGNDFIGIWDLGTRYQVPGLDLKYVAAISNQSNQKKITEPQPQKTSNQKKISNLKPQTRNPELRTRNQIKLPTSPKHSPR